MPDNEPLSPEVITLLMAGKKISAIKLLRKQSGLGLKAAKNVVETYIVKHPEKFPSKNAPSGGGKLVMYGLVVMAILLTYQFVLHRL